MSHEINYNLNLIKNRIEASLKALEEEILKLELDLESTLMEEVFNYPSLKPRYDLLNKLKSKKIKILKTLEDQSYGKRKEIRPKYELILLHDFKDHVINLKNEVLCGKNEDANDKVFFTAKPLNWTFYHAKVIGGGLVAMKDPNDSLGNSLACLYSKYLKVNKTSQGASWKGTKLIKGSKKGSFIFLDQTSVHAYEPLVLTFFKHKQQKKIYFGFREFIPESLLEELRQLKQKSFMVLNGDGHKRFEDFKEIYKELRLVNLDVLNILVPERYDLRYLSANNLIK